MMGLFMQPLFSLMEHFLSLLEEHHRAYPGESFGQVLPGHALSARGLLDAAEQPGFKLVQVLLPILNAAARVPARKPLAGLGQSIFSVA